MLLFIAVFGALLVTATFTDLQVSNILTAKALAAHTYYTNETVYGVVLEAVGSSPVYLMLADSLLAGHAQDEKASVERDPRDTPARRGHNSLFRTV